MVFRFIYVYFACRCLWGSEESVKFPWAWSYNGELLCGCWEWDLFPLIHIPSPSFKSIMGIIILSTSWDYCNAQRGQPAVMTCEDMNEWESLGAHWLVSLLMEQVVVKLLWMLHTTQILGWQDVWVGKSTCYQAWQPESQNPHGRREPAPQGCPLISTRLFTMQHSRG